MSEIGEALGAATEGALTSRAVEPERGEGGHFAEGACLNCGSELVGPHCYTCGQKAHLHRTIGAFMHDLLHGALHFEGKTWKTLPMLAFRPGQLTRRYIDGERAKFVSPMALFLFSVFLMFAVFQFAGISAPTDLQGDTGGQLRELAAKEFEQVRERQASLEQRLQSEELDDAGREQLEAELAAVEDQISAIATAQSEIPFLRETQNGAASDLSPQVNENGQTVIKLDPEAEPGDTGTAQMTVDESVGVGWIDEGLEKWRTNPGLMLYKLQTNFYKFSWLLIPLSIPFVWLLFIWKRRFKAYDHAIFVTYSLSFMTLFILLMTVGGLIGLPTPLIVLPSIFVPGIHIYKQLRGTYGLSRFSAFWRLIILSAFILVILTLFLQALLLLGAF